ncbi:acyl-CoA dehydrogenase family protein [Flavobacteriaceae bacterium]|nr:acyl-CoA dehydrogenase family protein [Flavobacteriaceae bacterium]MDC1492224.1 acyl-CoA dehydrogenase family protein [Flavobacteriaceae bacterium]
MDDVKYEKAKSNIKSNKSSTNSHNQFSNDGSLSSLKKLDKHNLSLASEAISIAENTLEITIKFINQPNNSGKKQSNSQVIRHQIAQLASEIECYKQFVYFINSKFENQEKEITMAKLISIQLMDKVVSQSFQMFGGYDSLEQHPIEKIFQKSKMIQISNNSRDLHDNISKFIIDQK